MGRSKIDLGARWDHPGPLWFIFLEMYFINLIQVLIRSNGLALEWVSQALRADRELALEAVRQNWEAASCPCFFMVVRGCSIGSNRVRQSPNPEIH